jgi:uncharacterized protein (DUF4415 family)
MNRNAKHRFSQIKEIKNLEARKPNQIALSDTLETPASFWTNAKQPNIYRPTKQPITLRLDSDLVSWFKDHTTERGYQTEINRGLRNYVTEAQRKTG